jgi:predicted membrane-bound mannosyltransferase
LATQLATPPTDAGARLARGDARRLDATAVAALALVLIGFGLRVYDLGQRPLWLDEGYTVYLQGRSVTRS